MRKRGESSTTYCEAVCVLSRRGKQGKKDRKSREQAVTQICLGWNWAKLWLPQASSSWGPLFHAGPSPCTDSPPLS